jgi:hypothetical protein
MTVRRTMPGIETYLPLATDYVAFGPKAVVTIGQSVLVLPGTSDVNLLCNSKRIIDLYAKIPDCTFNFRVAEQELHGS